MNDPSLAAGRGWIVDFLWPSLREGVYYTASVILLAHASLTLWTTTTEGLLELATCLGILCLDVGSVFSEAISRRSDRRSRALRFVGAVQVLDRDESNGRKEVWQETSGFDLKPGMVIKLAANSVVPADVKWLGGDELLCDTSFATNQDHRVGGGVGGDSGEDFSGFIRLGAATPSSSSSSSTSNRTGSPHARVPLEGECMAGAKVVAASAASGFARCQVLRVGASSEGWCAAAAHAAKEDAWRRGKWPVASPTKLGSWTMLLLCGATAALVPRLLANRPSLHGTGGGTGGHGSGGGALPKPSAAQLLRSLLKALTETLGLEPNFFSLPSWASDQNGDFEYVPLVPDPPSPSRQHQHGEEGGNNDGDEGEFAGMFETGHSGGGRSDGGGDDAALFTTNAALAALVAIDQCRALLHLGLVVVGHGTLGTKVLLQSVEAAAQRLLAKRGCLLKPRSTGLTAQRCAEVDTLVMCHSDPRPPSYPHDTAFVMKVRSTYNLDVKIVGVPAPSAAAGSAAPPSSTTITSSSSSSGAKASSPPAAAAEELSTSGTETTTKMPKKFKKVSEAELAAAASALGVPLEELVKAAAEEEEKEEKRSGGGGGDGSKEEEEEVRRRRSSGLGAKLGGLGNAEEKGASDEEVATFKALVKSLGLPGSTSVLSSFSSSSSSSSSATTTSSSSGVLVAPSQTEREAYARECAASEHQRAAFAKAMEERRKLGPHKVPLPPRPKGPLLPRTAVAAACGLVRSLQRVEGRSVLVTCDDAPDGRTLALLTTAHVGCATGNQHLTEASTKNKKKKPQYSPGPPPSSASSSQQQQQQQQPGAEQKQKSKKKQQQQAKAGGGARSPSWKPTAAEAAENEGKEKEEEEEEAAKMRSVRSGGDVALASGLPLGLMPLAEMLVVCRAATRVEHAAMSSRVVSIVSGFTLLLLDVATSTSLCASAAAMALNASSAAASGGGDFASAASSLSSSSSSFMDPKSAALAVAAQWAQSVVRRSVVFSGCLRVPLSLLLADVLVLFAATPELPPSTHDLTTAIMKASTQAAPPAAPPPGAAAQGESGGAGGGGGGGTPPPLPPWRRRRRGLTVAGQLWRFLVSACWGAGGAVLFHAYALPWLIPFALPTLHAWVGGYLGSMLLLSGDGGGGGGQENESVEAGGGSVDAAAAQVSARQFEQQLEEERRGVVFALSAVDRDTCSFLFLVFSAQFTALAGLAASRAAWRCRLALPATLFVPPGVAAALFLACNGVVGGVYAGADPAAAVATLLFTLAYHFVGGLAVNALVPPYP